MEFRVLHAGQAGMEELVLHLLHRHVGADQHLDHPRHCGHVWERIAWSTWAILNMQASKGNRPEVMYRNVFTVEADVVSWAGVPRPP